MATSTGGLLSSLTSSSLWASTIRKQVLPMGGSALVAAAVKFLGPGTSDDWRVQLSIPFNFFLNSAILAPLKDAGGLIFPYTPTINISHTATYNSEPITHQNFQFLSYQNSSVQAITITAPFYVEDATQAAYWIGVVQFLRSVTKMYTSETSEAGSPPPILSLNGYGDFVFKNVPVVVTSFGLQLDSDCDYITTEPKAGMDLTNVNSIIGAASTGASGLISGATTTLYNTFVSNVAHVPTKSTITISLQPIYSRESARTFSLTTFVQGGYISGGYV
jgi:hypothetical protein